MSKPVIFLDCDGVLNTPATWVKRGAEALDPDKVARLDALVRLVGADVVVSSSWRYIYPLADLEAMLRWRGYTGTLFGGTPKGEGFADTDQRGREVSAWLALLITRPPFVILDDLPLECFEGHGAKLVTTNGAVGLTDRDCEQAVRVLVRQGMRCPHDWKGMGVATETDDGDGQMCIRCGACRRAPR